MSVLLLSPDCVYERETAPVQRSSSLVPPSTPHLHGQRREVALMGPVGGGTAFLMAAVFSQTVARLVLKRRTCGFGADMQTQTTSERLQGAGTAAAASGAAAQTKRN